MFGSETACGCGGEREQTNSRKQWTRANDQQKATHTNLTEERITAKGSECVAAGRGSSRAWRRCVTGTHRTLLALRGPTPDAAQGTHAALPRGDQRAAPRGARWVMMGFCACALRGPTASSNRGEAGRPGARAAPGRTRRARPRGDGRAACLFGHARCAWVRIFGTKAEPQRIVATSGAPACVAVT